MSVIIGSSCVLWDHWCVSELNEYHIVRSPSTCDSSDLNGFHFVCQCIRQPSFCRVTRDMCHSVNLSAFLFQTQLCVFINETSLKMSWRFIIEMILTADNSKLSDNLIKILDTICRYNIEHSCRTFLINCKIKTCSCTLQRGKQKFKNEMTSQS